MKAIHWVLIGCGILVLVILWGVNWLAASFFLENWETRGNFGDMFGAVNALFAGLAFGGVIVAILLQRQELEYQRQELARTSQAQIESSDSLARQLKLLSTTGRMNCLSTMIGTYDRRILEAYGKGSPGAADLAKQVDRLTQELDDLYESIEGKGSLFR
jgi:hypothetical protein